MTAIPFLSAEYENSEEEFYVSPILSSLLSPQPIGHYHTNFKLESEGEKLILSDQIGTVVDSISFPSILSNMSYGRVVEDINNWEYFPQPIPMGENLGLSYIGITNPPVLNINGGFYPIGEQIIVLNDQENIQNTVSTSDRFEAKSEYEYRIVDQVNVPKYLIFHLNLIMAAGCWE